MAKTTEERFNNFATVYDLKQFLLAKKSRLERDISERKIAKDKVDRARSYIVKIEEILKTEYFKATRYEDKVYELMRILKDDDIVFLKAIKVLENDIKKGEAALATFVEDNMDPDFDIPDENEEYQRAIDLKKREAFWQVEGLREELETYKYRLDLCRKLKGMICRPDGFFAAVYK